MSTVSFHRDSSLISHS